MNELTSWDIILIISASLIVVPVFFGIVIFLVPGFLFFLLFWFNMIFVAYDDKEYGMLVGIFLFGPLIAPLYYFTKAREDKIKNNDCKIVWKAHT